MQQPKSQSAYAARSRYAVLGSIYYGCSAGDAIPTPTLDSSLSMDPLALPTYLVGSIFKFQDLGRMIIVTLLVSLVNTSPQTVPNMML